MWTDRETESVCVRNTRVVMGSTTPYHLVCTPGKDCFDSSVSFEIVVDVCRGGGEATEGRVALSPATIIIFNSDLGEWSWRGQRVLTGLE